MGTNEGNAGVCEGRHCGLEEDVWVGGWQSLLWVEGVGLRRMDVCLCR